MSLSPCSSTELESNRQTLSLEEKRCNLLYKTSSLAHQEEFLPGKAGQALEGAALGSLEPQSLEVSKQGLDVAPRALRLGTRCGLGTAWTQWPGRAFPTLKIVGPWDSVATAIFIDFLITCCLLAVTFPLSHFPFTDRGSDWRMKFRLMNQTLREMLSMLGFEGNNSYFICEKRKELEWKLLELPCFPLPKSSVLAEPQPL